MTASTVEIGSKFWVYDRTQEHRQNGMLYFEVKVIDETSRSWIISPNWAGDKIPALGSKSTKAGGALENLTPSSNDPLRFEGDHCGRPNTKLLHWRYYICRTHLADGVIE